MTIDMIVALIGASIVAYVIANRFRLIAPVLLIAAGVGGGLPSVWGGDAPVQHGGPDDLPTDPPVLGVAVSLP